MTVQFSDAVRNAKLDAVETDNTSLVAGQQFTVNTFTLTAGNE